MKRILLNASVACVALLVAALVAELFVRVVDPQQLIQIRPDLWQPVDGVGWRHRPNIDIRINTGERTVRVLTDRDGYRVGQRGRSSGRGVLLLGDSFMEALQVEHDQSVAGLLEASLSERFDTAVAIRNAGVGGWGPNQYLLEAQTALPRENYAAVVVVLYPGNDVVRERRDHLPPRRPTARHRLRVPTRLDAREFVDAVLYPINDFLEVRSHLYILARKNLKVLRMRAGLHPMYFPDVFFVETADSYRWAMTADICAEIAELAAQRGAATLFVLVPDALQVSPEHLADALTGFDVEPDAVDLDQPNRLLTEALEARRLRVLDVLPAFRSARRAGMQTHGGVDAHLTPDGHRLLSKEVLPVLAEMLDGPPEARPSVAAPGLLVEHR